MLTFFCRPKRIFVEVVVNVVISVKSEFRLVQH